MCGIVGFNSNNTILMREMLESIKHRGPDDRGIFETRELSLGHVRLSILDLSEHGRQPMYYDNLVMVYNGEVYNFEEIRDVLERLGYVFEGQSDSEVVLKAFHCWGVDALDRFIGMFAIAVYDRRKRQLTLMRDRVGVKPLYYYVHGGDFVFASELKPIMRYRSDLTINREALYEFFQFGYISSNLSIFEDCFKLPAGHYATFDLRRKELQLVRYWSILPFVQKPKFQKREEELTDELEALLIDAFSLRMRSDVPVGVLLSGGIDSSTVAAVLQRHYGNIHTFTIGFDEARYDEATWAKKVARHIGTQHTERYLHSDEAGRILNDFVDIYDEPFGDSSGIPTTLVSRVVKDSGVKVVLSADGGDEIFCGYQRYWYADAIGRKTLRIPRSLRRLIAGMMEKIGVESLSKRFNIKNIEHKFNQLGEMLKSDDWQGLYEKLNHNFKDSEMKQLLGYVKRTEEPHFAVGAQEHPMQGMMLWDYHRYMVDDILTKIDRATMRMSLEGREPLLDHRIAEFMAQVPFEFKYKDGTSKYLLRRVLERYLPKSLIDRPKMGFGIPMFEWFGGDLRSLFDHYLGRERIIAEGLLDADYIEAQHHKLVHGEAININKLWFILVFEMWYERYP